MKIVSVDPGLTSGFATYDTVTGVFRSAEYAVTPLYRAVERMIWAEQYPLVIVEKYTITTRTAKLSQQTEALRIIGALEYMCATGGITMHISPTSRKKFADNGKLRTLGWFKGGEGHADDAARHLLSYLSTRPEGAALLERLAA